MKEKRLQPFGHVENDVYVEKKERNISKVSAWILKDMTLKRKEPNLRI